MTLITPEGSQAINNASDMLAQKAALAKMLKTASDITCEQCSGKNFIEVYQMKKISGLVTGTGKDVVVPIPVFACADCGNVNKMFLPKEEDTE